jgi:hypothetical protein
VKCRLFGETNIVTEKNEYLDASICRRDTSLCGINGTYYEEKIK